MELYVRAVMGSDDFDKTVFNMDHFAVPCYTAPPECLHVHCLIPRKCIWYPSTFLADQI